MRDEWTFVVAVAALALIAAVRVASAQREFSATHDEPAHIACGYEWLTGSYALDPSHPPLARVLGAFPLWLDGAASQQGRDLIARANELLYRGGDYVKNLARARRGTLLLFVIAVAGVAVWARRTFSPLEAIIAAALFTTLPPILGHAGLVTTDMAVVAAFVWALIALEGFYRKPTAFRGMGLGVAVAFGVLAKFSFLVYFPPAALIVTVMRWPVRVSLRGLIAAVTIALFTIWAGYGFQFRSAYSVFGDSTWVFMKLFVPQPLAERLAVTPLPAVSLPVGLAMVRAHNESANLSFLLGEHGGPWWEYFPIVLFYKTPIPFLILLAWGTAVLVRRRSRAAWMFPLVALMILIPAMTSRINIGVRHVLPIYVPLAIIAAVAVTEIWKRTTELFGRAALCALLLWLFGGVAAAHPDYLAWFNEAAGPEPSRIVVDSNLEWGQDGLRLARAVRERRIDHLQLLYATNIRLAEHGVNAERLTFGPKKGWIAIGEAPLCLFEAPEMYGWLDTYRPVARVGKSIRLYYIP